jgi:polyhydroxyalkanoate synthase
MTQPHEDAVREERHTEVGTEASEHILGPNPVVGVRGKDIRQTLGMLARRALRQPHQVLAHAGSQKVAPTSLGNSRYRPQVGAPGTYVYE